jgi:hypothetical protein
MNYSIVEAYAKGHLAGARYSRTRHSGEGQARPENPYGLSTYLARVEWDRGFAEGYELQERRTATSECSP